MSRITLVGIDPGLVHTGAVALHLDPFAGSVTVEHEAILGSDAKAVRAFVGRYAPLADSLYVWVEKYRDRGTTFGTHSEMRKLEVEIQRAVPAAVLLDNTGVKKVITDKLMKLLGVWQFSTSTHHQDLRSAARIALYGAVKEPELNQLLTRIVISLLGITITTEKETANA